MCDYSLEVYRSRPAVAGEEYNLHRFRTGSMGFVAGNDCETAVCVPQGARLHLEGISSYVQSALNIGSDEEVEIVRLPRRGHTHRDAVRFGNGREVTLQSLNPGVRAAMLTRDLTALFELERLVDREMA